MIPNHSILQRTPLQPEITPQTTVTITLPHAHVLVIYAALKTLREKLHSRWHPVFDELLKIFADAAREVKQ